MQTADNPTLPTLHVTNYQQYIDASPLHTIVMDNLNPEANWPDTVNISIAYMHTTKKGLTYITTLALSILGKAYKISVSADKIIYDAQRGLDLNLYAERAGKDHDIKTTQNAFNALVANKKQQIIKAITCAYANYKSAN